MIQNPSNLLEVRNLKKKYPVHKGILRKASLWVQAVDGVSFALGKGKTLGLVGESGCGNPRPAVRFCGSWSLMKERSSSTGFRF
jgi:ABC-type microcin C transport system duplicated ATPase subunit YejF